MIDLRSDTVTLPSAEMRRFMANAPVGDDGYGEDPTVNRLEEAAADLLGMEQAVFAVSGTMANQCALRALTLPGDVVVVGESAHLLQYERGASAKNAQVQFHPIPDGDGRLDLDHLGRVLSLYQNLGTPVKLIALENTHMPSGGTPLSPEYMLELVKVAGKTQIYVDGARLANASVALSVKPGSLLGGVTAVSMCFSKGLGAPMGSVVATSGDLMAKVRLERLRLGGRFRQAGIVAAGALYAMEHNWHRLAEDHERARRLAEGIAGWVDVDLASARTNIVVFPHAKAPEFVKRLADRSVLANHLAGEKVRLVTHMGIRDSDVEKAAAAIREVAESL
jgi:threonine aldolase